MTRKAVALTVALLTLSTLSVRAEVRTDEKSRVEFAGMLGKMMNFFGGKSAREGTTSTVAVKGDRKATFNENTAKIIDLNEEKIYDVDLRKKSYTVTTFAELRRRMEEEQKKAEERAKKEGNKPEQAAPQEKGKEMQIDVDVKNTGEKKMINGFDTRQVITTIAMHEKGKTIEEAGGMIITMDSWLAPKIAAMKEIPEFDRRYAAKLYGPEVAGVSEQQMAAALAMYPMLKDAMGRMTVEGEKLDGTPIQQTVTMDSMKSAEQLEQEKKQSSADASSSSSSSPTSIGGMLGGFARRAAKKKEADEGPKARATFMTTTTEVLKVATEVNPTELAVPAGFKENK